VAHACALVLTWTLASEGCGAPPPPTAPPAVPQSPPAPAPLEIDPLPGSVAELEAIARDPGAGERGIAALEKISGILHAAAREPEAAQALRRLYLRVGDGPRSLAVAALLLPALDAAAEVEEADALRRHLACPAHLPYVPRADGTRGHVARLAQDHDQQYWDRWEALHPIPIDLVPKKKLPTAADDAETHYIPLYATCPDDDATEPASAATRAAAWLAVARAHRTRDARGGPFAIPRAVEAYERAMHAAQTTPRGPTMLHAQLELGEALHAEARHHAAAVMLVRGLTLCEETAACAPAEREEALSLLADSLAHVDYEGPPADAPVIVRPTSSTRSCGRRFWSRSSVWRSIAPWTPRWSRRTARSRQRSWPRSLSSSWTCTCSKTRASRCWRCDSASPRIASSRSCSLPWLA
jgi:hypothetical protein